MDLLEMIDGMPVFDLFTSDEKQALLAIEPPVTTYEKGETIVEEGDTSNSLFLILKGNALITKVTEDSTIRLSKITTGELFGEMSYFSDSPRRTNVVANDDVVVMEMEHDFFDKLEPQMTIKVKDHLISLLISRLDKMNENIVKISKWMRY